MNPVFSVLEYGICSICGTDSGWKYFVSVDLAELSWKCHLFPWEGIKNTVGKHESKCGTINQRRLPKLSESYHERMVCQKRRPLEF